MAAPQRPGRYGTMTDDDRESAAPLDDLARDLAERRRARHDDPDDDLTEAFEAVDVDEVDTDDLWDAVFEEHDTAGAATASTAGPDPEPQATATAEYTVPKHEYCQRCPHFSDPPETACTHEGTDIVEVVTVERFRVRNCPMVDDD